MSTVCTHYQIGLQYLGLEINPSYAIHAYMTIENWNFRSSVALSWFAAHHKGKTKHEPNKIRV